ncbi:hypothetical protein JHK87_001812 [Glycine soja]|nr:hypothetical protein JHK87_001812 [Glycine soja]
MVISDLCNSITYRKNVNLMIGELTIKGQIFNLECAVLPPRNNKEAMPLEATLITIFLFALNELASVFQMNVFSCTSISV